MFIRHLKAILTIVFSFSAFSLCADSTAFDKVDNIIEKNVTGYISAVFTEDKKSTSHLIYSLKTQDGTNYRLILTPQQEKSLGNFNDFSGSEVIVELPEQFLSRMNRQNDKNSKLTTLPVKKITLLQKARKKKTKSEKDVININPLMQTFGYITLACKFNDFPEEPVTQAFLVNKYASTYPGFNHYWSEMSYGELDLTGTATNWKTLPNPRQFYYDAANGNQANLNAIADDCAALHVNDVDISVYDGIQFALNTETLDGFAWGGSTTVAIANGTQQTFKATWLPIWATTNSGIGYHEMGHSLGMPHSSGPYGQTYDSQWDVMSNAWASGSQPGGTDPTYGSIGQGVIANQKTINNWITTAQIFTPTGVNPQAIDLASSSNNNDPTLYKMVKINNEAGTHFYTVEVRTVEGYDDLLPTDTTHALIHRVQFGNYQTPIVVDIDNNSNPNDAAATWLVGETYTNIDEGITISFDSLSTNGMNITVTDAAPPSLDFALSQFSFVNLANQGNPYDWEVTALVTNSTDTTYNYDLIPYLSLDENVSPTDDTAMTLTSGVITQEIIGNSDQFYTNAFTTNVAAGDYWIAYCVNDIVPSLSDPDFVCTSPQQIQIQQEAPSVDVNIALFSANPTTWINDGASVYTFLTDVNNILGTINTVTPATVDLHLLDSSFELPTQANSIASLSNVLNDSAVSFFDFTVTTTEPIGNYFTVACVTANTAASDIDLNNNCTTVEAVTITNGLIDVSADTDSDGMEDVWELNYGLDPNNPNDALLDLDNDGVSNLDEYLAGTDPSIPNAPNQENTSITRAAAAKQLILKKHGLGFIPPPASGSVFLDVSALDFNAAWIEQLATDGITIGCDLDNFCPNQALTKEQLAILVLKTVNGPFYIPPSASGTLFTDVSADSFAADWIEQMANNQFTTGCSIDKYCPKEVVSVQGLQNILNLVVEEPILTHFSAGSKAS